MDDMPHMTAYHLSTENVIKHRLAVWFESHPAHIPCPALELSVWKMGNVEVIRRAVLLQFHRQTAYAEVPLKLEYFLQWEAGRVRTISTLGDLQEALLGVTTWLVFVVDKLWMGVTRGFLDEIMDRRYQAYSLEYIVSLVYAALACIPELAAQEKLFPDAPNLAVRDAVARRFVDILASLNGGHFFEYAMQMGGLQALVGPRAGLPSTPVTPVRPLGLVASSPSSGAQVPATPTTLGGGGLSGDVCFAALGEHYQLPYTKCTLSACTRMHYEQLPPGISRGALVAMLSGLKPGQHREGLLAAIAQDPNLRA
jgi:hypothetical protein